MEVKNIINANKEARILEDIDLTDFALKNPKKWESEFLREVLKQYKILDKLKNKIPSWSKSNIILGASLRNVEQCSSEETAKYKFQSFNGRRALDLTGGFGVDSYFMSQKFDSVIYCEPNQELVEIVTHNFKALGITKVEFLTTAAEDFLKKNDTQFDLIFIDPDRRSGSNKKLVFIEDCQPNLLEIEDAILNISGTILVKYSPLLDISRAVQQLKNIKQVEVLAHKNEVKELLFSLEKNAISEHCLIRATNISLTQTTSFSFTREEEKYANPSFSLPLNYLYEPNSAILKAGGFKLIGERYNLKKLAFHSHYYTSETLNEQFPGKAFSIIESFEFNAKTMKKFMNQKFNVLARNFPLKTETIVKKYLLKIGGEKYLIFTQNHKNEKIILSCERTF